MGSPSRRGGRFWNIAGGATGRGRRAAAARRGRWSAARLERLEERALLVASVVINPLNELSFLGTAVANNLTVSLTAGIYTFNDTGETINVINNGTAFVTGSGTNTITVAGIASIDIDTDDGADTVNLRSTATPTSIDTSAGTGDIVNVGTLAPASGGDLQGITAVLTLDDAGLGALNLDDSGDATGRTVLIGELGSATLIGVSGVPNIVAGDGIGEVDFLGGTGTDTFTVGGIFGTTRIDINAGGGDDALQFTAFDLLNFGTFDGGTGTNRIDYSGAAFLASGVNVNLAIGSATLTTGIANVQDITGSPADDTLIGNSQLNVIRGGQGDDTIDPNQNPAGTFEPVFGDAGDDLIIWDPGDGSDDVDGGTGANIQRVNRGNGNNTLLVRRGSRTDPSLSTHTFFEGGGFDIDMLSIQLLEVIVQGGTDTLTVDFVNGDPFANLTGIAGGPGISYDGGSEADRLILQRSGGTFTATSEVYDAFGPGTGQITFDGSSTIFFDNLEPVDDTVPATNFTFNAPDPSNELNILNGPTVGGFATTQISSVLIPPSFELINFANKTNVILNAGADEDVVTLNNPTPATGMTNLTINTFGGVDQIAINVTGTGVAYTANAGAGNDTVSVLASALVTGSTYSVNGGTGIDVLIVDAQGGAVTVTPGVVLIAGRPALNFAAFEDVFINNAATAPPVPGPPVTFNAVEDLRIVDVVVATFTDPDPTATADRFVATIAWGDGTQSAGVIVQDATIPSLYYVQGTHTYVQPGTFTVTTTLRTLGTTTVTIIGGVPVTITGAPSPPVTTSGTANVSGLTVTGFPVVATAGTPRQNALVARFTNTDPGSTIDDFTAEINWGDGTPPTLGRITGTASPGVFDVSGIHTYAAPGSYFATVTVRSEAGAVARTEFIATVVGLTGTCFPILATEEVPITNVVLATIASNGGPAIDATFYNATINWGDGTITPGIIDPATREIRGSHTYEESGNYTLQIIVGTFINPNLLSLTCPVAVADVPIVITGRLDPASDSGVSDTDGITKVRQPTFFGTSEDGSRVSLTAQNLATGAVIPLGATTADAFGNYQLTSQAALPDGRYNITATAIDRNNTTTASALIASILIDTIAPRVTSLAFQTRPGRLFVELQDTSSGLAQPSIIDGRNYRVERPHLRPGSLLVGPLTATPAANPTDPQVITGVVTNRGRSNLRGGTYTITVFDSELGITDVAGNALDGEFFGTFPSGNGVPGGDFVAIVDVIHNTIFAPGPNQSTTSPNDFRTFAANVLPPSRSDLAAVARRKQQEAQQAKAAARRDAAQARAVTQQDAAQARAAAQRDAAQAQAAALQQALVRQKAAAKVRAANQAALQAEARSAPKWTALDRARAAAIRAIVRGGL